MRGEDTGIAVIIVNYGTADLTIEAVESVLSRKHGGRRVEVHVVDNASPNSDAARLSEAHRARGWGEGVTLHIEKANHGFGRGNNVVLNELAKRENPPSAVFLLNPDARLGNEAIDILASFLDLHPKVGAAGAALCLPGGSPSTAAFRFPTFFSEVDRVANLGPVSRLLRGYRSPLPPNLNTQRVDWVSGAAVMFRFEAITQAGFFDPAYFLYFEEVDLMRALARLGWETWTVAEARVVHAEGVATGVNARGQRRRRPAYVYESWRYFFYKNHGRPYAILTAFFSLIAAGANVAISVARRREPWLPTNYFADVTRHVLLPLLRRDVTPAPRQ